MSDVLRATLRFAAEAWTVGCLALTCTPLAARGQVMTVQGSPVRVPGEFSEITFAVELPGDRILVGDRRESRIVLIDRSMAATTLISRPGQGPDEYSGVYPAVRVGADRVMMLDVGLGRWMEFSGTRARSLSDRDVAGTNLHPSSLLGADTAGTLLVRGGRPVTAGRTAQDSSTVLRFRIGGTGGVDSVTRLLRAWSRIATSGPEGEAPTSIQIRFVPLAASEDAVMYPDGWVAIARVNPYRVDWRKPDGTWLAGDPLPVREIPLDARERQFFRERQRNIQRPSRIPDDAPWPKYLPPFELGNLVAAPDGALLIRRTPSTANSSSSYDVVDRRGQLTGQIQMKPDERILSFGSARVYIARTRDDGLEEILVRPWPR